MTDLLPVVTPTTDAGPQDPVPTTPVRAAGSARRTSSVDVMRADGPSGVVRIDGRARDAVTTTAGDAPRTVTVRLDATLDPLQHLAAIAADPPEPGLEELIGARVATGFRASVASAVPLHRSSSSLLYLLLDDLPAATLVSGYALQRAGAIGTAPRAAFDPIVDLCAGWAADATIIRIIDEHGAPPMTLGPPAPVLERPDDPDGWHELPGAPPRTVRRRRRIDVEVGDELVVDSMFRDSHFDDDGAESVVHEYSLRATIDPSTLVVDDVRATPRVLPYVECPRAAASASRLAGFALTDVRDRVRAELVGTSTCTHLNDLLRSLEDVGGLLRILEGAPGQS